MAEETSSGSENASEIDAEGKDDRSVVLGLSLDAIILIGVGIGLLMLG